MTFTTRRSTLALAPAAAFLLPLEALGVRGIGRPAGPEVEPAADLTQVIL